MAYFAEHVLACPLCGAHPLTPRGQDLACTHCAWQSRQVGGDTLSFATTVHAGPRMQTSRDQARAPSRLRELWRRLVFWRRFVEPDAAAWEAALAPVRAQELAEVCALLRAHLDRPVGCLLELGAGSQDHRALYAEFAEHAITSDIYRDAQAAAWHAGNDRVLRCILHSEQLPLRPASLDLLLTSHVVEHFPDRLGHLSKLRHALRPGALACHVVPIASGLLLGHVVGTLANLLVLRPSLGRGIHGEFASVWAELRATSLAAWRRLFTAAGFEILVERKGALALRPLPPWLSLPAGRLTGCAGSRIFLLRARPG